MGFYLTNGSQRALLLLPSETMQEGPPVIQKWAVTRYRICSSMIFLTTEALINQFLLFLCQTLCDFDKIAQTKPADDTAITIRRKSLSPSPSPSLHPLAPHSFLFYCSHPHSMVFPSPSPFYVPLPLIKKKTLTWALLHSIFLSCAGFQVTTLRTIMF